MILSLPQTLDCGQAFRFSETAPGLWRGIAGSRVLSLSQSAVDTNPSLIASDPFLSHYFDLETDYEAIKQDLSERFPVMKEAISYAPGIRILRQDPFEALISFVISQNNNIARIKGIISRLCARYGEPVSGPGSAIGDFAFPSVEVLASVPVPELRALGLGFRDSYVSAAANAVLSGELDFEELRALPVADARARLMKIRGIGPKVADCMLLFGLHRTECFPMDVWMKRVMAEEFPGKTGEELFGPVAGIAQQYLFHYRRTR